MNFTEAQLLSYSSQNKFLSEGEFRYGSTKMLSIESFIDVRVSNADASGVKESQEKLMQAISGAHDFEKIIVNGHDFGYGRITSIDSESAQSWDINQIRMGKHTFGIEISDSGENNLYNMTGDYFTGLKEKFSKHHLLENFDENFSFNFEGGDAYSYDHSVSAKYFSGAEVTDPIEEAKSLAEGIFEQDPSFGFLSSQKSGFYHLDGKKYFTETYDLQTNNCSFSKHFECKSRYGFNDPFSSAITHSLRCDEGGLITVSERGEVVGLDDDGGSELYDSALDGMNALIDGSFNRCTGVFSGYSGFYENDYANDLNATYLTLQKTLDKTSSNLTYDVSYNNSPGLSGAIGQHVYTLSLEAANNGVRNVSENGTVSSFASRGEQDPVSLYNSMSIDNNSKYRCGNFYSGIVTNRRNEYDFFQKDRFNLTESSIDYQCSGKKVSYTKNFTDDPSIIKTNNISKMDISTSDVFKIETTNAFFIPNQQKEILHRRGITNLASRNISANCIYQKPSVNFWTDPSYAPVGPESNVDFLDALKFVKNKMLEKAFTDEWITVKEIESMFIGGFSYNIGSDNSLSATMNIVYEEQ